MDDVRSKLNDVRERMVLGVALMQQLADLANLIVGSPLTGKLEAIAALGHEAAMRNLDTITALLNDADAIRSLVA